MLGNQNLCMLTMLGFPPASSGLLHMWFAGSSRQLRTSMPSASLSPHLPTDLALGACPAQHSMKSTPTDRHRAIAKRRSDGNSLAAVAAEFQTTVERVSRAIKRVEDYDRGIALLLIDPGSIEGLDLVGMLPPLVRRTLAESGITRLTDLDGMSPEELLRMPHISRRALARLLALLEECRGTGAKGEV